MQAARRLFDHVNDNRAGRQSGLCFIAVVGLLLFVGALRYHGGATVHTGAQQQRKVLDQNKSFCPGPATKPVTRPDSWWEPFSQKLTAEVAASDAHQVTVMFEQVDQPLCPWSGLVISVSIQGSSLVFYGDSITETWRGTDGGHPCSRCAGVPEVFQEYFSSQYSTTVLAVGGEVHTRAIHSGSCKQTTLPHQQLLVSCAIAVAALWQKQPTAVTFWYKIRVRLSNSNLHRSNLISSMLWALSTLSCWYLRTLFAG